MKAFELMTPNPVVIASDQPVHHAAELMREHDIGMLPVVDSMATKNLCGVITDRDITIRCVAHLHAPVCEVRDHMTPIPVTTVAPDEDISAVMRLMAEGRVRRVPVVNDEGAIVGIIAQADLALKAGRMDVLKVERVLEAVSHTADACPI